MHGQAGDVDHRLVVTEQQPDQQGGTTVVEIDSPQHVAVESQDIPRLTGMWPAVVVARVDSVGRPPWRLHVA